MKKLTTYKHVIWDWNGTLFDDAWLCADIMNEILDKRDMPPITLEKYEQTFSFPVIDYYRAVGFDFQKEPFEKLSTEFITRYEERKFECELRPNSRPTLKAVHERGLSQSVLSAYKQSSLDNFVAHFDLDHHFDFMVGALDHHAFGKEERGRMLIDKLGIHPTDVVMIGDTVHDVAVASAMGVDCCLIYSQHQDRPRLAASGVKVIESLDEILQVI